MHRASRDECHIRMPNFVRLSARQHDPKRLERLMSQHFKKVIRAHPMASDEFVDASSTLY
jgi:hypothetical protein